MTDDKGEDWYHALRRVAERKVRDGQGEIVDMTSLVHELEVRHVELELQNEELRHARNETEAARDRYSELFELAPVGYFLLDARGIILECNLTVSVYLELPRSQIVGRPFGSLLLPAYRSSLDGLLGRVFATGEREIWEATLWHKDGSPLYARIGAKLVESSHACLLAVTDISDRVEAETALRKNEARLRKVLQVDTVGTLFMDNAGTVIDANDTFLRWTGYSRDEVDRHVLNWLKLAPPEGQDAVVEQIRLLAAGGRFGPRDSECLCKDGSRRWLLLAGANLGDATSIIFCIDVNDRNHARGALIEGQNMLRIVIENSPERIFLLDRAGRLLFGNANAQEYLQRLGSRPDEPIADKLGKTAEELFADAEYGRAAGAINRRVIETGKAETEEKVVNTTLGKRIYQVTRTPYLDAAGQVSGLVGTVGDITERKLGEAARIAQLEQQRDTLVREVHHRIKNHLQGVVGLLRNRQAQSPAVADALQDAISQVLVIAEVYGLQGQPETGEIALCQLASAVLHGAIAPVPVNCAKDMETNKVVLAPNEVMPISLIINELVNNSFKHLSKAVPERPIRVDIEGDAERAMLRVRSGPARLPAGFDFALGRGTGTGLELVRAMLPSAGARVNFRQEGDEVVTELVLAPPVILAPTPGS